MQRVQRAPRGYFVFAFGGLALIVASIVAAAVGSVDGSAVPGVFLVEITAYFAGLIGFWWWWLVLRPAPAEPQPAQGAAPELGALKSWNGLAAAMAVPGGDPEVLAGAQRESRRQLAAFLAYWTAAPVILIGGAWIGAAGVEQVAGVDLGLLVAGSMIAYVVAYVPYLLFVVRLGAAIEAGELAIATLGLRTVESPVPGVLPSSSGGWRPSVVGETVLAGERHGTPVEIHLGRRHVTHLERPLPAFRLTSDGGKLRAEGEPPAFVREAIRPLRRARRWRGVAVTGGAEGVTVERGAEIDNGWLYDLWLAERLVRHATA